MRRKVTDPEDRCPYCDGHGETYYDAAVEPFWQKCDHCDGSGYRYYSDGGQW